MAQYQHPKDAGRVVEVGEGEGVKRQILESLGWKLIPAGQEAPPPAPAPKPGKQASKTSDGPKPLNAPVKTAPGVKGPGKEQTGNA